MKIESIADSFGIDPDSLEKWLTEIKDQYEKRQEGYKSYLDQTEVNALIVDIKKQVKKLVRCLNSMPIDIKEALNSLCTQQIIADDTIEEDDSNITYKSEDFLDDSILRLKKIERVTSKLKIHTSGQKIMHHKGWLVRKLRESWKDLKGSRPSKSSAKNPFGDYIEQVCEYMGIDKKGLMRRHLNTD